MIQELFPTKIYKVNFGDVSELKRLLLPKLDKVFELATCDNQGSMRNNGLCSYNACRDLHTWSETQELLEFIQLHGARYWRELAYSTDMTPVTFEMWANKYTRGDFIDWHNHSPIAITGSFYLQKPLNGGNILFEHPNATLLKHQPTIGRAEKNSYHTLFTEEITVNEGDLVLFPGYLNHSTQPNLSDADRIIIGTNIYAT